jgi:hypothetical protein
LDAGFFTVTEHAHAEPIDKTNKAPANLDRFQEVTAREPWRKNRQPKECFPAGNARVSRIYRVVGAWPRVHDGRALHPQRQSPFSLRAMDGAAPLASEDIDGFFNSFGITGLTKEW